jgi:diguanylate cyclase (GGDEF)-like protein
LRTTAKALVGDLRSSDRVARLGGDEFAVLLPEIGYEQALEAGRKIAMSVDRALGAFPPVRASIGVAWFGQADRAFPAMLKAADDLMYEVKKSGKDDMLSRRFTAAIESNKKP